MHGAGLVVAFLSDHAVAATALSDFGETAGIFASLITSGASQTLELFRQFGNEFLVYRMAYNGLMLTSVILAILLLRLALTQSGRSDIKQARFLLWCSIVHGGVSILDIAVFYILLWYAGIGIGSRSVREFVQALYYWGPSPALFVWLAAGSIALFVFREVQIDTLQLQKDRSLRT